MDDEPPSPAELDRLRRVANFQFGRCGADALFPGTGGSDGNAADGSDYAADDAADGSDYAAEGEDDVDGDEVDAERVGSITVTRTSSGRIEQCFDDGRRLFTAETNGRFVLSVAAGRRIVEGLDAQRHRVVVGEESVEFVREGRNAFAKFVRSVDPALRPGDEAVVVHDGDVLGVGRAELSATAMTDFDTGVAVFVRHGAGD